MKGFRRKTAFVFPDAGEEQSELEVDITDGDSLLFSTEADEEEEEEDPGLAHILLDREAVLQLRDLLSCWLETGDFPGQS